ncbi:MAG: hypothetical protein KF683_25530, partial [Rubrivivax sp.]|nr:hypothetical protein [Rubrivivax sp.]
MTAGPLLPALNDGAAQVHASERLGSPWRRAPVRRLPRLSIRLDTRTRAAAARRCAYDARPMDPTLAHCARRRHLAVLLSA